MQRIDTSTRAIDLFGAGKDGFSDGNPSLGIPSTQLDADFFNSVQEEIANVIEASGTALNPADKAQLLASLALGVRGGVYNAAGATGTADAITAVYAPTIPSLKNGMTLFVRAASANATTTPTYTPNAGTIAAKTIVKGNNLALVAGDVAGAGHWIELQYDTTLDKWVLQNPATGIAPVASQAEVNAGVIDTKAVTPLKLRNGFSCDLSTNGMIALPSWLGGMIIKIGTNTTSSTTAQAFSLPLSFPNAGLCAVGSHIASGTTCYAEASVSQTQITLRTNLAGGAQINWFAVGY